LLKLYNKLSLKYLRRNNRNVVPFFIFDYMECKNCLNNLPEKANFCNNCGAKVVVNRITFKSLLLDVFVNVFGFDSRFFITLRTVARQPELLLHDYLNGVRKRYINPFSFLAIAAGISLLVFNYFADDFIEINQTMNSSQIEALQEKANLDIASLKNLSEKEVKKLKVEQQSAQMQLKFNKGMIEFMLRYLNLLTFVFLLLFAVLSKWTFWKPYNFGEHLVINAFLYGFLTYLTLILFFFAIVIHPSIYFASTFIYIFYYMYVLGKFFKLTLWQSIKKLFRFLFGLAVVFVTIIILTIAIGILLGFLGIIKFDL